MRIWNLWGMPTYRKYNYGTPRNCIIKPNSEEDVPILNGFKFDLVIIDDPTEGNDKDYK